MQVKQKNKSYREHVILARGGRRRQREVLPDAEVALLGGHAQVAPLGGGDGRGGGGGVAAAAAAAAGAAGPALPPPGLLLQRQWNAGPDGQHVVLGSVVGVGAAAAVAAAAGQQRVRGTPSL